MQLILQMLPLIVFSIKHATLLQLKLLIVTNLIQVIRHIKVCLMACDGTLTTLRYEASGEVHMPAL